MFEGHDPYLVALSVAIAILGGYNGFTLAARIRRRPDAGRRLLLAGAAGFLAVGIWTMHFIGMLAAPLPPGTSYLLLPTIISFLICALVVGVSLFFVSIGPPSAGRIVGSAVLLGVGIASMHYVGIHGLEGSFNIVHDPAMVVLSVAIAVAAAYGGLRAFLARQEGIRLAVSAVAFGIAVSGMHYTAMAGMHFIGCAPEQVQHHFGGLAASQQSLSLIVAVLCFVITAGFLLLQVPDPRTTEVAIPPPGLAAAQPEPEPGGSPLQAAAQPPPRAFAFAGSKAAPLGGLGLPRASTVSRLPVESADGTRFIETSDIRSIRADAHYTRVNDGTRERMCPWSISEMEAQLDPALFLRVHRSHIVALSYVTMVRREGDGAVIELDGTQGPRIPVSRAKIAEVRARLGLVRRSA
jgi:NO-binding membrane sensor protein with MHYT domain